jgi:hypothetical protein
MSDGKLTMDKLRSRMNFGNLSLSGTIGNIGEIGGAGRESGDSNFDRLTIDLAATVSSADVGRISRLIQPAARGYQGFINGSANIKGTFGDPEFSAEGIVYGVRAFGLFLPIIRLESLSGNKREVHMPRVRAIVGRGFISADADLIKQGDEWGGKVVASGRSVDIRSLVAPIDQSTRDEVSGALDVDFKGSGSLSSFEGSGVARIPKLFVKGVNFTDLEAPFWVTDGFVVVEHSTARAYGGVVTAQIAKDLRMSDWGGRVDVKSADVSSALRDLMPDSEGTIAGSADLSVHVTGDTRRTSMQNAEGSLEIKNGEVVGFKGAEAVSKLLGGRPLRFSKLLTSFTVDGKTIYILPGSRVAAPKGDPAFNYVMADGSVGMEKMKLDLLCVGYVYIRALNSFVGGVQGLVSSAMDEGTSGLTLENFIGGAIKGLAKDEFRDVSLTVRGSSQDISIEGVKIAEPPKIDLSPELNEAERRREKEDERIRLNLEFPVGPGGEGRSGGLGSQVGGQVLQNALNGLFSF